MNQPKPSATDLINCIRLYFEVEKNFTSTNFEFKYYLSEIIKARNFNLKYSGLDFDMFLEYCKSDFSIISNSQIEVFKKFNFSTSNGKNAINFYFNLLIAECSQDLENGLLHLKDFKPKKLRKKSNREILSDYRKLGKEIDLKFKNSQNEPPI